MEAPATAIGIGPGTVLADTYRIERVLGEGGMGLVFEAQHLRIHKRVAIKVLRTAPDHELLARFRQEAEIASRIGHPNIIDVLDFNTLPSGTAYLVMERLAGESLAARMRRGPVPPAQALPILRQIASGLHAAHGANVIHRDLKPENVFLVPRELGGAMTDHVKILDFGISKVHGSSAVRTSEDVVLGTPRYMAPEQALGRSDEIDARADQFALGVIAFELLAGCPPFDGDNGTQVMFKIVYEEPSRLAPLAPDAPPHVVAAIERALSKRPQDRFDDMSELALALTGKALATSPARAREPSLPPSSATADGTPTVDASPRARSASAAPPPTVADSPRARTPAAPVPGSRRWWPVALVGGLAAAAALGLVVVVRAGSGDAGATPDASAPIALAASGAGSATTSPDASVAVVDAPPVIDAPAAAVARPADRPKLKAEALPPEALAAVEEAEQLLRAGRLAPAKAAAERALRSAETVRARLLLVEIACRANDLAAVNAAMYALDRGSRATARQRCARAGFVIEVPE